MKKFLTKNKYYVILFLSVFLLYANSLKNGYGLDDEFVTGPKNIAAKGLKSIPEIFRKFHVTDESGNNYEYRPITKVTFAIEHQFFGVNVFISHLVNLLLYFISLLVLFRFLKLVFHQTNDFVIFIVVLVFAFLPIHSEVVVSLKNRDVLLSFIFSFLGFIYILKYFNSGKWLNVFVSFIYIALAFFSKFDVLPLLVIIPLTGYQKNKISLKSILMIVGIFLLSYLLFGLVKRSLLDKSLIQKVRIYQYFENPLYFNYTIASRFSAALNSIGFYAKMLVFPNNMACYYGYNVLPLFSFTSLYAFMGVGTIAFLVYNFVKRFKKPDLLWYGVLFFSVSISMYSNFFTPAVGVVADRFLFFASVGFSLIVVYLTLNYKQDQLNITSVKDLKPIQKSIGLIILIVFAGMILKRNSEWKSKLVLFESDIKKYPNSVKLSLLSSAQVMIHINDKSDVIPDNQKLQKVRNAEKALLNAIKVDPTCDVCYNNIAHILLSVENDPASAMPYLMEGFKRDSTKKETACNIGIALYRLGKPLDAKKYLIKAIELDVRHEFTVPYEVLQDLYMKTNPDEGVSYFANELKKGHHQEFLNVLLGKSYFEAGDTLNSIKYYQQALAINPNNQTVSDFVTDLEVKFHKKAW